MRRRWLGFLLAAVVACAAWPAGHAVGQADPTPSPGSIGIGPTPTPGDGAPPAPASPGAAIQIGPTPTPGGAAYTGPTFGVHLPLDPRWTILDERVGPDGDFLTVTDGTVVVVVSAGPAAGVSHAGCVEALRRELTASLGLRDVAVASDADGEDLRGSAGERRWTVFIATVTADLPGIAGAGGAVGLYIECRPHPRAEALVGVVAIAGLDRFNAAFPAVEALLAGLSVADTSTPTEPSAEADGQRTGVITTNSVILRAEPSSFSGGHVLTLAAGTEVVITGPAVFDRASQVSFWPVRLADGTTGWVATEFVEIGS